MAKSPVTPVLDLDAEVVTITRTEAPYAGASIDVRAGITSTLYDELDSWLQRHKRDRDARAQLAALDSAVEIFVEHGLVAWNLERSGAPIPATVAGVRSLPLPLQSILLEMWFDRLGMRDGTPV